MFSQREPVHAVTNADDRKIILNLGKEVKMQCTILVLMVLIRTCTSGSAEMKCEHLYARYELGVLT